jgi:CDP-4-dehydro-6-deoxyglucose reductase
MGYQVRVQPSGHVFEAYSHESLLDAGLRAGLNLDHHCASGACGACGARLVSGQVAAIRQGDFRFPAREARDHILLCCYRPTSAVEIETHELASAAEIPAQRIRAKVHRLQRLQDEVILLQLRTPRTENLLFLAGQAVELSLDGLKPVTLALASCPCDGMYLRFHVHRRTGDPFRERVFAGLNKGQEMAVSGPVGDFTLAEESPRNRLFLAWESGFAAIASLIDHAIQLDEARPMRLYWLSGRPDGHYLSNYCRAWQDALDDFRYHAIDLAPVGADGFASAMARVAADLGDLAGWDCYAVLPPAGLAALRVLRDAGLPDTQLHTALQGLP